MDKNKLHDKLTEAFIHYQHNLENPFPTTTETKATMTLKYRNDYIFHNKVDRIVSGVMCIIDEVDNYKER